MTHRIKEALEKSDACDTVMRDLLTDLREGAEHRKNGRLDEAIARCEKATKLACETLGNRHRVYGHCLEDLGCLYEQAGDWSKARVNLEMAFDILLGELGNEAPEVLDLFSRLNHLYYYC